MEDTQDWWNNGKYTRMHEMFVYPRNDVYIMYIGVHIGYPEYPDWMCLRLQNISSFFLYNVHICI